MDVDSTQDGSTFQSDNQTLNNNNTTESNTLGDSQVASQEVAAAIAELDKMDKFKFQGQEWTPKDLEKAILRQKDYSQKTQSLAEDRKSFDQNQKFYDNLYADLSYVKANPQFANEFIKTYPEKFHSYLKNVLSETSSQQTQGQTQTQQQSPQFDVELQSRLHKLESTFQEQEVAKNTQQINTTIDRLSKQYPDAIPELVIGRVFEAYNQGTKPTDQTWEDTFKAVDQYMKDTVKAKYGDLVKKQTEANAKARDVDAGGGTPGRAPKKFGSLREVTEFAVSDLTGKRA